MTQRFGAVARYVPDALVDYEREQRPIEREGAERLRERQAQDAEATRRAAQERHKALWQRLSAAVQQEIRSHVLARNPHLTKHPTLIERFCIGELARRQAAGHAP